MLRLEMLPAACGDCLWLEYGEPGDTRIVIIDGGLRATANALRKRMQEARRARGATTLDVELLVVTHIDNDHIEGINELLASKDPTLRIKDIWFNGIRQLRGLSPLPAGTKIRGASKRKRNSGDQTPADRLGGDSESDGEYEEVEPHKLPQDLLGPAEGDELSRRLEFQNLPWNEHELWGGKAIAVADTGPLPSLELDGKLKLTLLGPSFVRLHELCTKWDVIKDGSEDAVEGGRATSPADTLGRSDQWPPQWKAGEQSDPSFTNGSSIALLAEHGEHALLLTGDAFAADLENSIERLKIERRAAGKPLKLSAFKLSHHGSDKNLTQSLLRSIECDRFLVSTDGSTHRHPDHQALLRILRFTEGKPSIQFNYDTMTTEKWRDRRQDVVSPVFKEYTPVYPVDAAQGLVLELP